MSHLDTALTAVRTALQGDGGTVILRPTQLVGTSLPDSGEYLMIDLIPSAPTDHMDGSILEDLNLQVAAWSSVSLTSAIANAEAARVRMVALGYGRTGGVQLLLEDKFAGVLITYTQVAAFDQLT